MRVRGFTLIELLVVLTVVALLLSIALPRFIASIDKAKDTVLVENLRAVRMALDKFKADRGRWPESLEELVSTRYLRAVPIDPITESDSTWEVVSATEGHDDGITDIRSGATGSNRGGKTYASY